MKNELIPPSKPTTATITIPGSKSYTNRALLLAALTSKTVTITNPLFSDDTNAMISCLKKLGIKMTITKNRIRVLGSIHDGTDKKYSLNAKLSGTTIRFITALATLIPGTKIIYGDDPLNKRPIKDLVDGLRQMGATIEYVEKEGFPPLKIISNKIKSNDITLNGNISSQYLSAILMIAPLIGLTITIKGKQISQPYIDMTCELMQHFGIQVENNDNKTYLVSKQNYVANNYTVEGDFSSAGYFFAIAALTQSTFTIKNLNPDSKQADKKLLPVLEKMGSTIMYKNHTITIKGEEVKPLEIDVTDFPDQAQTLAVLAAFAKGKTILKGIQSLRVKETNRVLALQNELGKMGIKTIVTNKTMTIFGGNPKAATIATYGDHRMAMSFSIAGAKISKLKISDAKVVNKTFPEFWKELQKIGIKIKTENKTNIILIGMRGSGKSTIGKLLAKKLQKKFLDLDTVMEDKFNLSVGRIVEQHGWDYFRKQEAQIAKQKAQVTNTVIATGGGIILQKENIDALQKKGIFVFLQTPLEILLKRIMNDKPRAPLTNKSTKEEIKHVWTERKKLYENYADICIHTKNLNEKQIVAKILKHI